MWKISFFKKPQLKAVKFSDDAVPVRIAEYKDFKKLWDLAEKRELPAPVYKAFSYAWDNLLPVLQFLLKDFMDNGEKISDLGLPDWGVTSGINFALAVFYSYFYKYMQKREEKGLDK